MSDSSNQPSPAGRGNKTSPAGRGRGRGFSIDSSPLRKPDSRNSSRPGSTTQSPRRNASTSSQGSAGNRVDSGPKTTVSDSSVGTSIQSSSLDVLAPEFVPMSANTRSVKSLPALSVNAQPFVPTLQPPQAQVQSNSEDALLICFIENALTELLHNPSKFDQTMPHITAYFATALNDARAMEVACDVIFEWAVTETGLSYICARVCEHVSSNVPNNHNGRFHQHMLKRCHQEHKEIKQLLQTNQVRASSFAVFLSELYSRQMFRVSKVMEAVLEILEAMMFNLTNQLARSVGQIMKMCGACLEDDLATAGETQRMESLISAIKSLVSSPPAGSSLNRGMSGLLKSVLTLRAANWGRVASPTTNSPISTPPVLNSFTHEPVFYNTTGQRITREEAGYGEDPAYWAEGAAGGVEYVADDELVWSAANEDIPGAGGDYSESEEITTNGGDADDIDLDILVINDDDEQMTEEMWAEFERFEAERDRNLTNYDDTQHY